MGDENGFAIPVNQWVKVSNQDTASRYTPGLAWVPGLKRFVLFGGGIRSAAERPYDVLSFDVSAYRSAVLPGGVIFTGTARKHGST